MAYYLTEDRAVQEKSVVRISQYDYVISVLYPIASTLPKLSVCTLYLRIFKVKRGLYRLTCGVIAFLIGNAIAWLIPTIFVCSPIRTFWSHRGASGKCLNWPIFGTWISLPNIVSDLLILVLPMRTLWRTQMKPAKKLGLMVTFATGSIGMIGACLRLSSYIHVTYIQQPGKDQSTGEFLYLYIPSYSFAKAFSFYCIQCGLYLYRMRDVSPRCVSPNSSSSLGAITPGSESCSKQVEFDLAKTSGFRSRWSRPTAKER